MKPFIPQFVLVLLIILEAKHSKRWKSNCWSDVVFYPVKYRRLQVAGNPCSTPLYVFVSNSRLRGGAGVLNGKSVFLSAHLEATQNCYDIKVDFTKFFALPVAGSLSDVPHAKSLQD